MLGSLSLMACTLLLAAVPSLSSSLQPREEANLPAIGYVMADGVRTGINPLAIGDVYDMDSIIPSSTHAVNFFFADSTLSRSLTLAADEVYSVYYDGTLADDGNVTFSGAYDSIITITCAASASLDVYLPDLSYWHASDDGYYLTLAFLEGSPLQAIYTNRIDGTEIDYTLAELGEDVNPVGAIGDGLGVIGALGGALSSGFDGVFLDNGALTSVGTFSFVLLGLGISVGIVKKCFNWVTGRHGM